jgi:beta-glucosidase
VVADRRLWRSWDTAAGAWRTLPDAGRLLLARGLGDVRASLPLGAAEQPRR